MQPQRIVALLVLFAGIAAVGVALAQRDDQPDDVAAAVLADVGTAADDEVAVPSADQSESADESSEAAADLDPTAAVLGERLDGAEFDEPLPILGTADTLTNLDGWLNTEYTSFEDIRADHDVVVVQFWTFGCINCKNTLEAMAAIHERFADESVAIVGVHAPEFSYEADIDNLIEAAADLGVVWPIAIDTDKRNFHRWQEGRWAYWPRAYLIDSEGQIRQNERGDGLAGYQLLATNIQRLLDEGA